MSAHAENTASAEETAFTQEVSGKLLFLRGFNADTHVQWSADATSGMLAQSKPEMHALSLIQVSRVQFKPGHVQLHGAQFILVRLQGKQSAFPTRNDVDIDVSFQPAQQATVLPTLKQVIFYSGQEAALMDLPADLQHVIAPEGASSSVTKTEVSSPTTPATPLDCSSPGAMDAPRAIGAKSPRALKIVNPETPSGATPGKELQAKVLLSAEVTSSGKVEDLWLLRPAMMPGFDEQASIAFRQYQFAPATCHDTPVSARIQLYINFMHL